MSIYIFFRVFKNPNPPKDLVLSAIDTFHIAILENLASKSCLPNIIRFRHDIFQYIFNGKGTKSDDGKYTFLAKNDFVRCAFPEDWDQLVDCMGDGVKVTFPIKARIFLSQSPKKHSSINGLMQQLPRYSVEKRSVSCMKQPLSLSTISYSYCC